MSDAARLVLQRRVEQLDQQMKHRLSDINQMQERVISALEQLRAMQDERAALQAYLEDSVHVDERGVTWLRPTAWAYAQVCAARETPR